MADEACLSAPGLWWPLERSFGVTARGRDMYGKPVTVRAIGDTGQGAAARGGPSRRRAVRRPSGRRRARPLSWRWLADPALVLGPGQAARR
ncbi:hypothetical protein [Nonomuraea dietziae]|uniref:hypothetical protein n=1 Tax=Nonomuraea dietziae TaxID=65515 RepID=UPI0031D0A751